MSIAKYPPRQFFADRFTYDPLTGAIRHRPRPYLKKHLANKEAGTVRRNGRVTYRFTAIHPWSGSARSMSVPMHHIAWILGGNELPKGFLIDHKDGDGLNNRLDNLRLATKAQNRWNCFDRQSKNVAHRGVYYKFGGWEPTICVNGKKIYLGRYRTLDEAVRVRVAAVLKYHGDFASAHNGRMYHKKGTRLKSKWGGSRRRKELVVTV